MRNSALAGLQAAIAAAIALPLVHLSPWSHLIGFAALGALVALFGRFAPEQRRQRIVLLCALLQTGTIFAMSSAAWLGLPLWTLLVLLAASCGVLFFLSVSGRFGAPGALIFVFAAGVSMEAATSFPAVIERTAVTAAAAALAWLICASTESLCHKTTAQALLITYLANPGAGDTAMVPERVLDTMLGALIGISAAVLFSTVHDRQELARRHASRTKE